MVRRGAGASQNGQGADRVAVGLIWLFGLAPIVFPAAVFASVTVLKPASLPAPTGHAAVLQEPERRAVMAQAPSGPAKLEWRATKPVQLDRPIAPASLGAPRPWLQIPGAVAIRQRAFQFARAEPAPAPLEDLKAAVHSVAPTGWVMRQFASVRVLDGLRIGAGSLVLALDGLKPPAADATCRRLDGVMESCLARAEPLLQFWLKGGR